MTRFEIAAQPSPRGNRVLHFGRVIIDPVVALAGLRGKLDDRQRLDRVDSQLNQVFEPVDHVEERAHAAPTVVIAPVVGPVVCPYMKLIDNQIAERRHLETLVVPGVALRAADDREASRVLRVDGQLAGVRVALGPRRARALDEKPVRGALVDARDEPRPLALAVALELARPVLGRAARAPGDGDLQGIGRPDAEGCPLAGNEVRPHGSLGRDMLL